MDSQVHDGKAAWHQFAKILPYIELEGKITEENINTILERLDVHVDSRVLKVKANWHMFKQFHVYCLKNPLFFLKELWQPEFLREILGLHMGIHFFDDELCPKQYIFGTWKQEGKQAKPILITTYVKGQPLKKNSFEPYLYELGRQHAFHQVLSMYDVDWRHFIIQNGIIVRIDFGKSFANLDCTYQGFWELPKAIVSSPKFQEGVEFEYGRIQANLAEKRDHVQYLFQRLEAIGNYRNFFIDFNVGEFLSNVKKYWETCVPFSIA